MNRLIPLVLVATFSSGGSATETSAYSPAIGQVHPDFTLPRIDNREATSLSDFRGRKVLLIHFASW